jgi:hypothetical protein
MTTRVCGSGSPRTPYRVWPAIGGGWPAAVSATAHRFQASDANTQNS